MKSLCKDSPIEENQKAEMKISNHSLSFGFKIGAITSPPRPRARGPFEDSSLNGSQSLPRKTVSPLPLLLFILITPLFLPLHYVYGFCGFYVAKGDTKLFNKASQVVLVRHEDKTVISMMNDYEGSLKNFAMVVPVPSVLQKEQVHVGDKKLFERIDSFTAPRLVEYFDKDPCMRFRKKSWGIAAMDRVVLKGVGVSSRQKSLGVTVEEKFTVGEYDIVILSATESRGLETWLRINKYTIPKGARRVLGPYISQKMKFFVAKVNLEKQAQTGLTYLRPLQFAFESEKFMLPIRLGMLNAKGPQELFVYVLTKKGRVETTNYVTVKIPTNIDIPPYVKNEFSDFYKDFFKEQVKREKMRTVFMEYFWDMGWCDPCAAEPLTQKELRGLGVFWLNNPSDSRRQSFRSGRSGAQPVKVTRLHLRYTHRTFPDDLMFHETSDKRNFQGRYILRHPWKGSPSQCEEAQRYFKQLPHRQEKEAQSLARLTGWNINQIRSKMNLSPTDSKKSRKKWWKNLWQ